MPEGDAGRKSLLVCNKPFLRLLHDLKVFCPYRAGAAGAAPAVEALPQQPPAKRIRLSDKAPESEDTCSWCGTYSDLLAKHLQLCPHHVVPCPRNCGEMLARRLLESHEEECTKIMETCNICGEFARPGTMAQHRKDALELHFQLLEVKVAAQAEELAAKHTAASNELVDIKRRLGQIEVQTQNLAKTQHVTNVAKQRHEELLVHLNRARDVQEAVFTIDNFPNLLQKCSRVRGNTISLPPVFLKGFGPFRAWFYPAGQKDSMEGCFGFFMEFPREGLDFTMNICVGSDSNTICCQNSTRPSGCAGHSNFGQISHIRELQQIVIKISLLSVVRNSMLSGDSVSIL